MDRCPLCTAPLRPFFSRGVRDPSPGDYQRCRGCSLIVLKHRCWPTLAFEREYYQTHENRPDDPGYRRFLGRLLAPLEAHCPPPAQGVDWGCGPHPVLADMLCARGYSMQTHDPVFAPDRPEARACFDLVTCTEVLEHLHDPIATLGEMATLLRPGGTIAIMTGWPPPAAAFHRWHYRRDPTHVAFYGPDTLRWIAAHLGWAIHLPAPDIALFRIPEPQGNEKREACNEIRGAPETSARAC
ncbi:MULTISPECIES: class I SAM-dependent methyltransferase [unclassified Thioalkalivibrio]|uniref:class I SAM-dependent methyltransferase n=1 Tax=unclassified Thioalkalivibrio TaxID=2621013 RepID=UPI00036C27E9|nr:MULTISPECIES: class I SAM-dependent methyltransferase [unclassified Thioalkalivibrio]